MRTVANWTVDAACAGQDPNIFFPEPAGKSRSKRADYGPAKAICATCPVTDRCLAEALARRERQGCWGNTTPEERRAMDDRQQYDRECRWCRESFVTSTWHQRYCTERCRNAARNERYRGAPNHAR